MHHETYLYVTVRPKPLVIVVRWICSSTQINALSQDLNKWRLRPINVKKKMTSCYWDFCWCIPVNNIFNQRRVENSVIALHGSATANSPVVRNRKHKKRSKDKKNRLQGFLLAPSTVSTFTFPNLVMNRLNKHHKCLHLHLAGKGWGCCFFCQYLSNQCLCNTNRKCVWACVCEPSMLVIVSHSSDKTLSHTKMNYVCKCLQVSTIFVDVCVHVFVKTK